MRYGKKFLATFQEGGGRINPDKMRRGWKRRPKRHRLFYPRSILSTTMVRYERVIYYNNPNNNLPLQPVRMSVWPSSSSSTLCAPHVCAYSGVKNKIASRKRPRFTWTHCARGPHYSKANNNT